MMRFTKDFCLWCTHFLTIEVTNRGFRGLTYSPTIWESFTTTYRQLIELNNGVSIIDTPGMRELGMANTEFGIDNTFSDILELEQCCRFSDCKHDTEPGCAIKSAIETGELSIERYTLYKSLSAENTRNYARKKEISKWAKAATKFKRKNYDL